MVKTQAKVIDATHLELATPLAAGPGTLVEVSVAAPIDREREEWAHMGMRALADSYDEDEPEYTEAMLRERNPGYIE